MKRIFLILAMFCGSGALAAELPPVARTEIAHLFAYLEHSGCQFKRNGSWYDSSEAVAHLKKKYDYLQKKKLLGSAEDFITRGAAESSMSGQPYLVKCGSAESVESGPWFRAELAKFRKGPR